MRRTLPLGAFPLLCACAHAPAPADAADALDPPPPPLVHHELRFDDLPPPFATPSALNPPTIIPRPRGQQLRLPEGFHIAPYADSGFDYPRWVAVAPNGDAFVSDARAGTLTVLRGVDPATGRARERHTFATGLTQPFGIAFMPGYVYVGDVDEVLRFPYEPGDTQARGPAEMIAPLPGGGYHEHWTRNLLFANDFKKLFVTVGSSTNDGPESDPERGAILEMSPDGRDRRTLASGTRNPIGLAWRPGTSELWAVVQERDGLGEDLVPDYVTHVEAGAFYGWPWAYLGPHADPAQHGAHPELVAETRAPDLLLQSHVAVMDLVFYEGAMFPSDWRGDAILAFHGSWNRARRVGYELARVHMNGARALAPGGYDDFVTGWMLSPEQKQVWGRPVGLAVLPDGSLLVVDDAGARVWRITYRAGS